MLLFRVSLESMFASVSYMFLCGVTQLSRFLCFHISVWLSLHWHMCLGRAGNANVEHLLRE